MSGPVWLGVDLGTGGVRALAVTGSGAILGRGDRPLRSHRSGSHHEQDPEEWWTATAAAISDAVADLDASRVAGVAVDGTSGTVLVVDGGGRPLTPALMYDDGRAGAELDLVNAAGGATWSRLGYRRMQTSWGLPKLVHLLAEHPDARGGRLQHQVDVVNAHLVGGPVATDLSNALKTGADLEDGTWPGEVHEALGLPASLFPPLVRPGEPLGSVGREAAARCGLVAGTPVLAGATDGTAAQLASGATEPGDWNVVLGTTMVFKGVTRDLLHDPQGVVYSHRAPDGSWLPGGASSTGAGIVGREQDTGPLAGWSLEDLTAAADWNGPAPSVVYPLVGEGERFPFVAPAARGFTLHPADGRLDESPPERFAALLQGVALVERLAIDGLDRLGADLTGRHVSTGGGTANDRWTQLRADVTGRDLEVPPAAWSGAGSAAGAALLAASSHGSLREQARAMVPATRTFAHDPERGARFEPAYRRLVTELADRGWLPQESAGHALATHRAVAARTGRAS